MNKKIFSVILSILLVALTVLSFFTTYANNRSGTVSAATCNISAGNKAYIINKYSDCKTVEELIMRLDNEICKEYTYYYCPPIIFQHFDIDNFIKTKKGLCFDYACYAKIVFNTIFPNVKVYVCDVRIDYFNNHSYNFIETDTHRYAVDFTTNQYKYKNNQKRIIYEDIGTLSFDEYAKLYNEEILNYH